VRWNRWHNGDQWSKAGGYMVFEKQKKSHLGIILKIYQSTSKARCWTADVAFADSILNHHGEPEYSVPLNCLELTG